MRDTRAWTLAVALGAVTAAWANGLPAPDLSVYLPDRVLVESMALGLCLAIVMIVGGLWVLHRRGRGTQ